ncbi:MAG: CCA tRNA nucleotidyltransferase [Campylobacterota bacterium]|nr:CCA tRNA nucleotidyltransferase [Campylobacterota bacterium]
MIDYPNSLNKIFDKLDYYNAKPIIIGGYIRDFLLNIPSNDIDIEVYNISSYEKLENILQEFGDVNSVGKSFGVCKLSFEDLSLDFTLPRIDSKINLGHLGFDIKVQKDLDFTTATSRRDFTINAIGYDLIDKKLLDPYDGISDLQKKSLKMVDIDSFAEDPLRVLRAIGFCSRFDFKMDSKLFLQCSKMIDKDMLNQLPKERIYEEIKKVLLKSKKPSVGFELLKELEALKYFPNLVSLNKEQWLSSMKALDNIANSKTTNSKTDEVLMLAVLCFNFSAVEIENFISSLTNDKKLLQRVLSLLSNIDIVVDICSTKINNYKLYKLSTKVKIIELVKITQAIYGIGDKVRRRAISLNILDKEMPAILKGRDLIRLGMKPSSKFAEILKRAYEAQMHSKFNTYDEATAWLNSNYVLHNLG